MQAFWVPNRYLRRVVGYKRFYLWDSMCAKYLIAEAKAGMTMFYLDKTMYLA
ncbi:hypothetical protein DSUL_80077 [Desulfovibrionales bacterium]